MESIIEIVRNELISNSDEKTLTSSQRFFKESILTYGVKVPVVHRISKELLPKLKDRTKDEIFEFCEILWQSGYIEESFVACNWSYSLRKQYKPEDFQLFERWIDSYINNWASCDTFCNHTVGDFIEKYPEYIDRLKEFALSENRWMRRAAAVSLIVPARRGKFLNEIMGIADLLLTDKDDLVQKGYGWMLKAASEAHRQPIFDYVMKNKGLMPRTALRYAIEKMPEEMRHRAMGK